MEKEYEKYGWSSETIVEMANDLLAFDFILEIMKRMENNEANKYLSTILMNIAPVMVYEFAQSLEKMGIKNKKELFNSDMHKVVQKERENIIHKRIVKSSQTELIEKEMGLDFKEKVYDINIVVINDELVDMNYELFNRNLKEEIEFWDSLFGIPQNIINALLMRFNINEKLEDFFEMIDIRLNILAKEIDQKLSCERYSYSVKKLFLHANGLENIDKTLILYRYRLVISAIKLNELIADKNIFINDIKVLNMKSFLRKYNAVIIYIIGEELKNMNTKFGESIQADLDQRIDDKFFWKINCKLRNNIHYVKTDVMSKNEIKTLDKYQGMYLRIVCNHFKQNIFIDIDNECRKMTLFLK